MGVLQSKELVIPATDNDNKQQIYRLKVEEIGRNKVNQPAAQTPDNKSNIKKFISRQFVRATSPFKKKRKGT
jgi:hypothetical protein